MIGTRAILALATLLSCSDAVSTFDGGVDSGACPTCPPDAGLCDPQFPPVPPEGCPAGEYVCQENDPGFSGCRANKFCYATTANFQPYSCENVPCNPPIPDGGCPAGEFPCALVTSVACVNSPFCAGPSMNVTCDTDAGVFDADSDGG